MPYFRSLTSHALALVAVLLAACSPAAQSPQSPVGQAVTVTVSPDSVALRGGGEQAFAAAVTGSAVTTVTWSVREGPPGGAVSAAGLYAAPGTPGSYHVVATSDADPTVSAVATVIVAAPNVVVVAVSPATQTLAAGASATFTASVAGTTDTAVTWSVQEAACGSVTAGGVYTAPSAAATCHVVATSHADPTKTALATVSVTAPPANVTVTVSPATRTLVAGSSATFTASVAGTTDTAVTWSVREASCGSVTAGGVYTAPSAAATCHVVATSHADATKTAAATVTVTAAPPPPVVAVTVTPSTATVNSCQTTTLAATVTGTTNTSVTWSVTEAAGGTVSGGVYTAPSTAGTYHVVATSQADNTKTATATLTVVDKILSVVVAPATLSLAPGATGQFTATVTTTCGSVSALRTVTAPLN